MIKEKNNLSMLDMPYVSVVIPCRNEEKSIAKVLDALAEQYHHERYEIIVADGLSTDSTPNIVSEFAVNHPMIKVHLIKNTAVNIPSGLNSAIKMAKGDIIVRIDGHSIPSPNYIKRCVDILISSSAQVVGAPIQIVPGSEKLVAKGIAQAISNPFGVGNARYRLKSTKKGRYVDTVPFGVFWKSLWERLGGFNETLLINEDYDFFYRARKEGMRIYLDDKAYSIYIARSDIIKFISQYFQYGLWKAQMIKINPGSIKLRQLMPPAFSGICSILILLSFFGSPFIVALFMILLVYFFSSILFAFPICIEEKDPRFLILIPLLFLTIHYTWGIGFLIGLFYSPYRDTKRIRV